MADPDIEQFVPEPLQDVPKVPDYENFQPERKGKGLKTEQLRLEAYKQATGNRDAVNATNEKIAARNTARRQLHEQRVQQTQTDKDTAAQKAYDASGRGMFMNALKTAGPLFGGAVAGVGVGEGVNRLVNSSVQSRERSLGDLAGEVGKVDLRDPAAVARNAPFVRGNVDAAERYMPGGPWRQAGTAGVRLGTRVGVAAPFLADAYNQYNQINPNDSPDVQNAHRMQATGMLGLGAGVVGEGAARFMNPVESEGYAKSVGTINAARNALGVLDKNGPPDPGGGGQGGGGGGGGGQGGGGGNNPPPPPNRYAGPHGRVIGDIARDFGLTVPVRDTKGATADKIIDHIDVASPDALRRVATKAPGVDETATIGKLRSQLKDFVTDKATRNSTLKGILGPAGLMLGGAALLDSDDAYASGPGAEKSIARQKLESALNTGSYLVPGLGEVRGAWDLGTAAGNAAHTMMQPGSVIDNLPARVRGSARTPAWPPARSAAEVPDLQSAVNLDAARAEDARQRQERQASLSHGDLFPGMTQQVPNHLSSYVAAQATAPGKEPENALAGLSR